MKYLKQVFLKLFKIICLYFMVYLLIFIGTVSLLIIYYFINSEEKSTNIIISKIQKFIENKERKDTITLYETTYHNNTKFGKYDYPIITGYLHSMVGVYYFELEDSSKQESNLINPINAIYHYNIALNKINDTLYSQYCKNLIKWNIARSYDLIAYYYSNDHKDNDAAINAYKKAEEKYKEVLDYFTIDKYPYDFIKTQIDRIDLFRNWAKIENKKDNLLKAQHLVINTLPAYDNPEYSSLLDKEIKIDFQDYEVMEKKHIDLLSTLGDIYVELAGIENKADNLQNAKEAYQQAINALEYKKNISEDDKKNDIQKLADKLKDIDTQLNK